MYIARQVGHQRKGGSTSLAGSTLCFQDGKGHRRWQPNNILVEYVPVYTYIYAAFSADHSCAFVLSGQGSFMRRLAVSLLGIGYQLYKCLVAAQQAFHIHACLFATKMCHNVRECSVSSNIALLIFVFPPEFRCSPQWGSIRQINPEC